jgi:hypothetical protein
LVVDSADAFGFAEVCAALSERFGTRFAVTHASRDCVTISAVLESGLEILITDCEDTLSPLRWHRDGRAAGFYVSIHRHVRTGDDADGEMSDQLSYASSNTAAPTAEEIGQLVHEALTTAMRAREP